MLNWWDRQTGNIFPAGLAHILYTSLHKFRKIPLPPPLTPLTKSWNINFESLGGTFLINFCHDAQLRERERDRESERVCCGSIFWRRSWVIKFAIMHILIFITFTTSLILVYPVLAQNLILWDMVVRFVLMKLIHVAFNKSQILLLFINRLTDRIHERLLPT